MFKRFETAAIHCSLKSESPEEHLNKWHNRMLEKGYKNIDMESIQEGLRLLQAINSKAPIDTPKKILNNIDWYSQTAAINDIKKTKEMVMDFFYDGYLEHPVTAPLNHEKPEKNISEFTSPEAKELFISAVRKNDLQTVKLFLQGGIDLHYRAEKALCVATNYGLENSLYSESQDYIGYQEALKHSETPPECKMMKLLLQYGADPNAHDGELLLNSIEHQNLPIAKILLDAGADPSKNQNLALFLARDRFDYKMMDMLLHYNADSSHLSQYEIERINDLKPLPVPQSEPPKTSNKLSPYDKIKDSRKELVDTILKTLEKEGKILPDKLDQSAVCPQNPVSDVFYRGGNRIRLMYAAIAKNSKDPRWCTYQQAKSRGWQVKKGAKGVLCEKWIYEKEVEKIGEDGKPIIGKDGKPVKEKILLEHPLANSFIVFNGEDIDGIPKLSLPSLSYDEKLKIAEDFIKSSECPIKEIAQEKAYYSPTEDTIVLPLRDTFKTTEDFLRTTLHEMSHSTGHPDRLNRPLMNYFGTPEYAREELNAEIGSIFTKCDLGFNFNNDGYIEERHRQYIKSWIAILKDNPNEFFIACSNADKISRRLIQNYERQQQLQNVAVESLETQQTEGHSKKASDSIMDTSSKHYDIISLQTEFAKSNFVCTPQISKKMQELNKLTGEKNTLKDVWQKWRNIEAYPQETQTVITAISEALKRQELQQQIPIQEP